MGNVNVLLLRLGTTGLLLGLTLKGALSESYKINGGLSLLSSLGYVAGRVWGYSAQ